MDTSFPGCAREYVPTTTIYQDNKSTILLAENGKASSSRRTRHLNVRYYFIMDQIKKGHVKVAFCPTQDMVADFFTKPLHGNLFVRMRERILNLPTSKISSVHRSVLEQRKAEPENTSGKAKSVKDIRGKKVKKYKSIDKTHWKDSKGVKNKHTGK